MKRIFAAFALIAAMVFSSCTKVECDCPKDQPAGTQWQIKNYVIKESNWEFCSASDGTNGFFRAQLNAPELDKFIWQEGAMLAYIVNSDGGQQVLPSVRHYEMTSTDGYHFLWTETVDFEFQQGKCFVYVTANDFDYGDDYNPGEMSIRLVLIW